MVVEELLDHLVDVRAAETVAGAFYGVERDGKQFALMMRNRQILVAVHDEERRIVWREWMRFHLQETRRTEPVADGLRAANSFLCRIPSNTSTVPRRYA